LSATLPRLLVLALAVVALDQATKHVVMWSIPFQTSRPVLGDLVRLTYIKNQGIAFGLFSNQRLPFSLVSIVAMLLILLALRRIPVEARAARYAMATILGGAAGNLIDRIRFREVVDFIDIGLGSMRWPVFNVADMAVTVGVLLFLLGTMFRSEQRGEKLGEEGAPLGPA
jgi:signal peptidase II